MDSELDKEEYAQFIKKYKKYFDDEKTEWFSWTEAFVIIGVTWAIAYALVGII